MSSKACRSAERIDLVVAKDLSRKCGLVYSCSTEYQLLDENCLRPSSHFTLCEYTDMIATWLCASDT